MVVAENLVKEFIKSEKKGRKTIKTPFKAVDGVSLTAHDGETLGIIGPNGAGKTTVLRMLGGLMAPTSGTVNHYYANGEKMNGSVEIKQNMGYLSNNTRLYDKFSVREFLKMMGELYGFSRDDTSIRIEEITSELSLESFIDSSCGKLSTGQTQRVNIARCLFANPQLYILDEPTLGLDIMSAETVVSFMEREKAKGKTIIYSTHYLEEAQRLCDRIILLNHGKIAAEGSPEKLSAETETGSLREAFLHLIGEEEAEL